MRGPTRAATTSVTRGRLRFARNEYLAKRKRPRIGAASVPCPRLCVGMRRTVTHELRRNMDDVSTHAHAKPWHGTRPSTFTSSRLFEAVMTIRIGIVTISDRASQGVYEDRGGPAIRQALEEILSCPWEPVAKLIPDDRPTIERTLTELCDVDGCCQEMTGGTGPSPSPRCDAGGDGRSLRQAARRVRRADAGRVAPVGAHGDPLAADRRHPRQVAAREPARQPAAIRECSLSSLQCRTAST